MAAAFFSNSAIVSSNPLLRVGSYSPIIPLLNRQPNSPPRRRLNLFGLRLEWPARSIQRQNARHRENGVATDENTTIS